MEIYLKGMQIHYIVAFYPLTPIKQKKKKEEIEIDKKRFCGRKVVGFGVFLYNMLSLIKLDK